MNQCRLSGDKARIIRIEKIKASESLLSYVWWAWWESLEIRFAGWQAGHGDAKHLERAGLLLRAPALGGLRPTVSREHRKEPRSEQRDIST
jgi:hypothetical protein